MSTTSSKEVKAPRRIHRRWNQHRAVCCFPPKNNPITELEVFQLSKQSGEVYNPSAGPFWSDQGEFSDRWREVSKILSDLWYEVGQRLLCSCLFSSRVVRSANRRIRTVECSSSRCPRFHPNLFPWYSQRERLRHYAHLDKPIVLISPSPFQKASRSPLFSAFATGRIPTEDAVVYIYSSCETMVFTLCTNYTRTLTQHVTSTASKPDSFATSKRTGPT